MAGILSGVARGVEELGAPEVANHRAVTVKHVQHRPLFSIGRLAEVVTVVGVGGRRQEPQASPAALLGKGEDAGERGLRDDREVDLLAGVLGGAVELVEQRDA